jgi:diacylglycerol kinase family enzyme
LLDVVIADDSDRQRLCERLDQFRSDPTGAPALRTHRGRHLKLTCAGCLFHIDDELWRGRADTTVTIELSIEPAALTFLVPATP